MTGPVRTPEIGADRERADGWLKVTGRAPYALEQPTRNPAYVHPLQATIARGRVTEVDSAAAEAVDGVIAVLSHVNAPAVASTDPPELAILQSPEVAFRGQLIGAVVAETLEVAREAADLVKVRYTQEEHDAEFDKEHDDLVVPRVLNGGFPVDTAEGDVDTASTEAAFTLDVTYTTPTEHNNPMEPHSTVALRTNEGLRVYDSTQGVHMTRSALAPILGMEPDRIRVIAWHVGGGFGSKGTPHPHVVLAAMAADRVRSRPVKLALTRRQMFSLAGYRTPTRQRVRIGADPEGLMTVLSNDVLEQTSRFQEFAEQTGVPFRGMYRAPNRRTTHRLTELDVAVPSWMRAPGEAPGMYALEAAMDEMAELSGLDPIEFRIRNEPDVDPESGLPYSSRHLITCLREGARRFGWEHRSPVPGTRRDGNWHVGVGVASSTYPVFQMPGTTATIRAAGDDHYVVAVGATDIGTGTWTALAQVAADTLEVPVEQVELRIGDTNLPQATVEGGSSGITSWGSAIVDAAANLRDRFGAAPPKGAESSGETPRNPEAKNYAMHAFGAQFAEVRVHADSGEIRVPRLLGIFAAGRIVNPRMARSQLTGGMIMGLSMALHEESIVDPRFGHVLNRDFAQYHIPTSADVGEVEADWIDEHDPHVNPMGTKGIGELGIVGTAAAISNAAYHATGVRVRQLPLAPENYLS